MILTELDRVVVMAIASGFLSGLCQSTLNYSLLAKSQRQLLSRQQHLFKFIYSSLALSIVLGTEVFALSAWETSMSAAELNHFTIAMAILFAITPLSDLFWSFVFSRFQQIRS